MCRLPGRSLALRDQDRRQERRDEHVDQRLWPGRSRLALKVGAYETAPIGRRLVMAATEPPRPKLRSSRGSTRGRPRRPGPRSHMDWRRSIGEALRHLDDLLWLQDSPLADLAWVRELANSGFPGHPLREAITVRELLRQAVDRARTEVLPDRATKFLDLFMSGIPGDAITQELGLKSRQHLWQADRRDALEAVRLLFFAPGCLVMAAD